MWITAEIDGSDVGKSLPDGRGEKSWVGLLPGASLWTFFPLVGFYRASSAGRAVGALAGTPMVWPLRSIGRQAACLAGCPVASSELGFPRVSVSVGVDSSLSALWVQQIRNECGRLGRVVIGYLGRATSGSGAGCARRSMGWRDHR